MAAPLLLLIVFDGLGNEIFLQHYASFGNLSKFYSNSPKVSKGATSVYPSITAPNLMSIATGLYSETHGITGNYMKAYPSQLFRYNSSIFSLQTDTDEDGTWWDNGINMPVWTVNEMASSSADPRYSGGMLWSGAGVAYKKKKIKYYERFEPRVSWYYEVDEVINWFTDESRPANCVFLYFDDPDLALHSSGSNSKELNETLQEVDSVVGYLMDKLEENNLRDKMNIIITADHGFVDVPVENYNEIYKLNIPETSYEVIESPTIWTIYPFPAHYSSVYERLKEGSNSMNYSVWLKQDMPDSAHYKYGAHVGPIILQSDLGFYTVLHKAQDVGVVGAHGYNNSFPSMNAVFLAQGPAINASAQLEVINNVDLYPLMCAILKIKPPSNNGSFEAVSALLNDFYFMDRQDSSDSTLVIVVVSIAALVALVILCVVGYFILKKYRNSSNYLRGLELDENPLASFDDNL